MSKPSKKSYTVDITLTYSVGVDARSQEEAAVLAYEDLERAVRGAEEGVDTLFEVEYVDVEEDDGSTDEDAHVVGIQTFFQEPFLTESGVRSLDEQEPVALSELLTSEVLPVSFQEEKIREAVEDGN